MPRKRVRIGSCSEWDARVRFNVDANPRTWFATWFAAAASNHTLTTMMAHAIREQTKGEAYQIGGKTWQDYYDDSEAVTWLNVLADGRVPMKHEDVEMSAFIAAHRVFFYDREGKRLVPKRRHAEALWPRILDHLNHWLRHKDVAPWLTGEVMVKHLKEMKLSVPTWPDKDE